MINVAKLTCDVSKMTNLFPVICIDFFLIRNSYGIIFKRQHGVFAQVLVQNRFSLRCFLKYFGSS